MRPIVNDKILSLFRKPDGVKISKTSNMKRGILSMINYFHPTVAGQLLDITADEKMPSSGKLWNWTWNQRQFDELDFTYFIPNRKDLKNLNQDTYMDTFNPYIYPKSGVFYPNMENTLIRLDPNATDLKMDSFGIEPDLQFTWELPTTRIAKLCYLRAIGEETAEDFYGKLRDPDVTVDEFENDNDVDDEESDDEDFEEKEEEDEEEEDEDEERIQDFELEEEGEKGEENGGKEDESVDLEAESVDLEEEEEEEEEDEEEDMMDVDDEGSNIVGAKFKKKSKKEEEEEEEKADKEYVDESTTIGTLDIFNDIKDNIIYYGPYTNTILTEFVTTSLPKDFEPFKDKILAMKDQLTSLADDMRPSYASGFSLKSIGLSENASENKQTFMEEIKDMESQQTNFTFMNKNPIESFNRVCEYYQFQLDKYKCIQILIDKLMSITTQVTNPKTQKVVKRFLFNDFVAYIKFELNQLFQNILFRDILKNKLHHDYPLSGTFQLIASSQNTRNEDNEVLFNKYLTSFGDKLVETLQLYEGLKLFDIECDKFYLDIKKGNTSDNDFSYFIKFLEPIHFKQIMINAKKSDKLVKTYGSSEKVPLFETLCNKDFFGTLSENVPLTDDKKERIVLLTLLLRFINTSGQKYNILADDEFIHESRLFSEKKSVLNQDFISLSGINISILDRMKKEEEENVNTEKYYVNGLKRIEDFVLTTPFIREGTTDGLFDRDLMLNIGYKKMYGFFSEYTFNFLKNCFESIAFKTIVANVFLMVVGENTPFIKKSSQFQEINLGDLIFNLPNTNLSEPIRMCILQMSNVVCSLYPQVISHVMHFSSVIEKTIEFLREYLNICYTKKHIKNTDPEKKILKILFNDNLAIIWFKQFSQYLFDNCKLSDYYGLEMFFDFESTANPYKESKFSLVSKLLFWDPKNDAYFTQFHKTPKELVTHLEMAVDNLKKNWSFVNYNNYANAKRIYDFCHVNMFHLGSEDARHFRKHISDLYHNFIDIKIDEDIAQLPSLSFEPGTIRELFDDNNVLKDKYGNNPEFFGLFDIETWWTKRSVVYKTNATPCNRTLKDTIRPRITPVVRTLRAFLSSPENEAQLANLISPIISYYTKSVIPRRIAELKENDKLLDILSRLAEQTLNQALIGMLNLTFMRLVDIDLLKTQYRIRTSGKKTKEPKAPKKLPAVLEGDENGLLEKIAGAIFTGQQSVLVKNILMESLRVPPPDIDQIKGLNKALQEGVPKIIKNPAKEDKETLLKVFGINTKEKKT